MQDYKDQLIENLQETIRDLQKSYQNLLLKYKKEVCKNWTYEIEATNNAPICLGKDENTR